MRKRGSAKSRKAGEQESRKVSADALWCITRRGTSVKEIATSLACPTPQLTIKARDRLLELLVGHFVTGLLDIVVDLRQLYDAVKDPQVKEIALALIATEPDVKYQKKYAGVWRKA